MKEKSCFTNIFPQASIISFHRLENGTEGDVYNVVTENFSVVVKFFSKQRLINYPDTLNKEVKLLDYLSSYTMATPKVFKYSNQQKFLCYYYIDGEQVVPNKKEFGVIAQYLKSMSQCNVSQINFLPILSKTVVLQELLGAVNYEPYYNTCLQKELSKLRIGATSLSISHGDFHHGNMIWGKDHNNLTLIDWDEALIAPVEYDISRFFISHAVFSNIQTAQDFITICEECFDVDKEVLSFFIHYNAYYCLIRYRNWSNSYFGKSNVHSTNETREILENLIIYKSL